MSNTPKFLSKQELELQEVNYIFSLSAERDKLQEQLITAKYFFKNILDVNPSLHGGNRAMHQKNCINVMKNSAENALATIENEGSGDE